MMVKMAIGLALFLTTQVAQAGCIERLQDYVSDPALVEAFARFGRIERIAGTWEGHGHLIEFHVLEDRIRSRVDRSDLADIRICSTNKPNELSILTLNRDGSVSARSKIKARADGSIGVQGKGTLGTFVGFSRTESYELPSNVVAAIRPARAIASAGEPPRQPGVASRGTAAF